MSAGPRKPKSMPQTLKTPSPRRGEGTGRGVLQMNQTIHRIGEMDSRLPPDLKCLGGARSPILYAQEFQPCSSERELRSIYISSFSRSQRREEVDSMNPKNQNSVAGRRKSPHL